MSDPTKALASLLDDATGITTLVVEEGTINDLARRLDLAQQTVTKLRDIIDAITESLSARMEDDSMTITGVGNVIRKKRTSSAWMDDDARERMYDDAQRAIIQRVAIDPMTGEIHPPLANAVRETWRLVQESFSFTADPKSGFRKTLDLRPDTYRTKYVTGYTVTIEEETI